MRCQLVASSSPMTTYCRFNGNSLGISWQLDGNSLVSQSGIPTGNYYIGQLLASQSQLKPMTSIMGPIKFCYLGPLSTPPCPFSSPISPPPHPSSSSSPRPLTPRLPPLPLLPSSSIPISFFSFSSSTSSSTPPPPLPSIPSPPLSSPSPPPPPPPPPSPPPTPPPHHHHYLVCYCS